MSKGVIQPCMKESNDFISEIFLTPKKSLNQNVTYHHFEMDTLHSILKLVKKDCWMLNFNVD